MTFLQRSIGSQTGARDRSGFAGHPWEASWPCTPRPSTPECGPLSRSARHTRTASPTGGASPGPVHLPLEPAVARDDGVARGYWHAAGDEVVPWQWSRVLHGLSPHPRHLRVALGGHHRSLQHDPAVQADTVAFLERHLRQ